MRKPLKWTGIGLAILASILVLAAIVLYVVGGTRLNRTYDVAVPSVAVPTADSAIARGGHLVRAVALCAGCHGDDLAGDTLMDEPLIATIYASNLTAGQGGIGGVYGDTDFVRAIRHGVNREGRGLMIMHSDAYQHLGAYDLGAIIAYVKSMPPVDRETPPTRGAALGRIFVALGMFDTGIPLIPAEVIDHDAPLPQPPPQGVTPEYGRYLVSIALCGMCHGPDLQGAPPIDPSMPPGPDIAGYASPGGWTAAQFANTIRTGVTPFGKAIDATVMPWEVYANMTDDELGAIWRYMMSLGGTQR